MSTDTEAICEVVEITEILPHSNADKLEIAHFKTKDGPVAYTVVTGKGEFKPGDLAGYVGVDSVVPLFGDQGKRWDFLKKRLDGENKDRYRVKAARLRGIYSEGILCPLDTPRKLGDELWDAWDIYYYERPVTLTTQGSEPSKVVKAKNKFKAVFPEYTVQSLRKVPNLFDLGEIVVVREKIHGTNARFGYVPSFFGFKWLVGSHRTIKTDVRPWYERLLNKVLGRERKEGYYGVNVWEDTATKYNLKERLKLYKGYVFYGEIFGFTLQGGKIQDLTYGGQQLRFVVFDIYDTRSQQWLDHLQISTICADLELDEAPLLYFGPYNHDTIMRLSEGKSKVPGADNIIEGTVTRPEVEVSPRRVAKWVGEGYRLRKSQDEQQVELDYWDMRKIVKDAIAEPRGQRL